MPQSNSPPTILFATHFQLSLPRAIRQAYGDLVATRYVPTANGQTIRTETSLLETSEYDEGIRPFYIPCRGLLPFIENIAPDARIINTCAGPTLLPLPEPVLSDVGNPALAEYIKGHSEGVIEFGGQITKAEMLIDVCHAFPTARVLFLSPHLQELNRMQRAIHAATTDIRALDTTTVRPISEGEVNESRRRPQIVLCTPERCVDVGAYCLTDIREFDIVVLSDSAKSINLYTSGFIDLERVQFRIFGFRQLGQMLSEYQSDLEVGFFGINRLRLPERGFVSSAVLTAQVENSYKIRNLWKDSTCADAVRLASLCTKRNDFVASVADGIYCRKRICDDLVQAWLNRSCPESPAMLMIVHSLSQSVRLLQRLPEWSMYLPMGTPEDFATGLKRADCEVIKSRRVGMFTDKQSLICTGDAVGEILSFFDPHMILQANPGIGIPQFPATWLRHRHGEFRTRLVIDFSDQHRMLRQNANGRMRAYAGQDFLKLNAAPVETSHGFTSRACAEQFIRRSFRRGTVKK